MEKIYTSDIRKHTTTTESDKGDTRVDKYEVIYRYSVGDTQKKKRITLYSNNERDARMEARALVRNELRSVKCFVKKT